MTFKMNHVHLKTRDPEATAKFYVETLGAKIVSQSATGGYRVDLHGLSLNVTKFLEMRQHGARHRDAAAGNDFQRVRERRRIRDGRTRTDRCRVVGWAVHI